MKTIAGFISFTMIFAVVGTAAAAEFVIREYPDRFVVEYDGSNETKQTPAITRPTAPRPAPSTATDRATADSQASVAVLEQLLQTGDDTQTRSKPATDSDGAGVPTLAYSSAMTNPAMTAPLPSRLNASPSNSATAPSGTASPPPSFASAPPPYIAPPPSVASVPTAIVPPVAASEASSAIQTSTSDPVQTLAQNNATGQDQILNDAINSAITSRLEGDGSKVLSRMDAWMKRLQFMKDLNQKALDAKNKQ